MVKQVYYHYTNKTGARGITKEKVIKKSTKSGSGRSDDARYGEGVYLTKLSPKNGKSVIAYNNYDSRSLDLIQRMIESGKVDWCLKLELDSDDVERCNAGDRDVYRYLNGDLTLDSDTAWELIALP